MSAVPHSRPVPAEADAERAAEAPERARRQLVLRELNEQIRGLAKRFGVEGELELVCECGDCVGRLSTSVEIYERVRRFPTRFLILARHAGEDERVVEKLERSAVVEKVGPSAAWAILFDPRKGSHTAATT